MGINFKPFLEHFCQGLSNRLLCAMTITSFNNHQSRDFMKCMIFWKQKHSKMQKLNPGITRNRIHSAEKAHGETVLTFNQQQAYTIHLPIILKCDNVIWVIETQIIWKYLIPFFSFVIFYLPYKARFDSCVFWGHYQDFGGLPWQKAPNIYRIDTKWRSAEMSTVPSPLAPRPPDGKILSGLGKSLGYQDLEK